MPARCHALLIASLSVLLYASPSSAQIKIKAVASFSILGDLVKNVGGDRIKVKVLSDRTATPMSIRHHQPT